MRPFLFLSGEYHVTQPAVFRRDDWQHSMSPKKLVLDDTGLHRPGITENLKGLIYYARAENIDYEIHNLAFIKDNNIPCWPSAQILQSMTDRHVVMQRCVEAGLVNHSVLFLRGGETVDLEFPYVVKIGQEHRGEGKYLINDNQDLPPWEGLATVEPFFVGQSVRILIIGDRYFGISYDNPTSWIKNSCGCDVEMWEAPIDMVNHAKSVASIFNLEIAGVDYIVSKDSYHFLEINQYPGLNVSDEAAEHARKFLDIKMSEVEQMAYKKS